MLDFLRAELALGIAGAICLLALVCLGSIVRGWRLRRWARRTGAASPCAPRLLVWGRRGVLALALLVLLCIPYSLLVEPNWLAIEQLAVSLPKIVPGTAPIRLVLISDTHSEREPRLENELPAVIKELRPDLIVFAGDSLNESRALPVFRRLMTALATIAPTYVVRGNWDVWYFHDSDLFGGTGVTELTQDLGNLRLVKNGIEIRLTGFAVQEDKAGRVAQENEPRIAGLLDGTPEHSVRVFVHHYSELADIAVRHGADLVLSGDTHGGQARVPFLGELVRLSRYGGYREAGLHHIGRSFLYISRGIGMEGGAAPRARFLCRPEVTLIEIGPETGSVR